MARSLHPRRAPVRTGWLTLALAGLTLLVLVLSLPGALRDAIRGEVRRVR